jgi:thiol-disulfide isomerase/thioredoxin
MCIGIAVSVANAQSDANAAVTKELNAIVARVQEKLRAGEKSATQLAPETAALAALRAKYADQPGSAAKIAQLEYSLFRDVLKDGAKTAELRTVLSTKYRDYIEGTRLAQELAMHERMEQARATQAALVGKPAPRLDFKWSTDSKLKSLNDLKGKVILLDFWATWCGPCIATFPEMRELVEHYKGSDLVVLGVTSLQGYVAGLQPARIETKGDPEKEYALMRDFIKAKEMTWSVVFSEQPVFNPDYGVMGIPHMAIVGPDGTLRYNGLGGSMPRVKQVIDSLLAESRTQPAGRSGDE